MIEFREGEPRCRWNGILMTDKNCRKLFGIEGEIDEWDDGKLIIYDGTAYTDLKPSQVIMRLGNVFNASEPSDPILTEGYINYPLESLEREFNGQFVINPDDLALIDNIRPLNRFKEDFPKFDRKKYYEFYNELDEYYEKKYYE